MNKQTIFLVMLELSVDNSWSQSIIFKADTTNCNQNM